MARCRFAAGDDAPGTGAFPRWPHWASYVVGPLLVLAVECRLVLSGVRLVIDSQVPEGKGVSSSAALETAVMQALATLFEIAVEPYQLALMCQRSENQVSAAACGVMDQMTCVFGERDRLMALLCQPALLQPFVTVPDDISFWGLDSGERHTVGASDYASVRTAAFMGLRMLAVDQARSERYLADIPLTDFERDLAHALPERMPGGEFYARYRPHVDTVTRVDVARSYLVRAATAHPVHERQRAELFRRLLSESSDEERRVHLGTLMYESHASYQGCGLGSPGTNRLVELVRREGAAAGLYGARITGGGSGGTVVVMGRSDAADAVARVTAAYERVSGYRPHVFAGSSSGVAAFGAARVRV
jgi:L-arabinokinase